MALLVIFRRISPQIFVSAEQTFVVYKTREELTKNPGETLRIWIWLAKWLTKDRRRFKKWWFNPSTWFSDFYKTEREFKCGFTKTSTPELKVIFWNFYFSIFFVKSKFVSEHWIFQNKSDGSFQFLFLGEIVGFDEYMNLVLDNAAEVHLKRGTMKKVGRIMLKGDNITLIQSMDGTKDH